MQTVSELLEAQRRKVSGDKNKDVWGDILYNVKVFGAKGDAVVTSSITGTDDTLAVKAAIAEAKENGGGVVLLPPGKYIISETLTIDASVSIWGVGSDSTNMDNFYATEEAVSVLVWKGGATPMINITGRVGGISLRDFAIHGNDVSTIGIKIDQLVRSNFQNLRIMHFSQYGMFIQPVDDGIANSNTMFNTFQNISLLRSTTGLCIQGTGISNVCHNVFTNLEIEFLTGGDGIYMGDSDNNSFFQVYTYRRSGTGYGARLGSTPGGGTARSNYFWHLQAVVKAESGSNNMIFGYDRENGQTAPEVDSGSFLFWTENGNNSAGWNFNSPIKNITVALTGAAPTEPAVNGSTKTAEHKLFQPDTFQQLSQSFDTVSRKLKTWYYDGSAAYQVNPYEISIKGLEFLTLGDKKHTYGTAAPTTGTWKQGEIVYNTAPAAGGKVGWICTADGTPGTWKPFGAIDA